MYQSILDRLSTDMSIHCRPRVDRCFGQASTNVSRRIDRDHIGRLSVNYRRDISQLSADTMVLVDVSANSRHTDILGEVSVHYRSSIGEVSRPTISTDTALIYRPILNRASTTTPSILDRYLIVCWSTYWPIYRPIHRSWSPIGYMIQKKYMVWHWNCNIILIQH